ncbi:MAG: CDP-alcohol phosphatidyltransferase family protein [Rubricoccaceae bacterium]
MKHLPNVLTIGRMIAAPVSLYLLWIGTFWAQFGGTLLFVLAAISDYYDGHLARKYDVSSRFGQFLDPLADKVLVLGTFVLLPFLEPVRTGLVAPAGAWLPWLGVGAIAVRDVAVTLLRSAYERRGRPLATSRSAKWKTAWQLTFLITVLVFLTFSHGRVLSGLPGAVGEALYAILLSPAPLVFLLVTAAVTVYTGAQYFAAPRTGAVA